MCLPLLIFPCTIKYRSSLLAPAHLGGPGKRAVKWLWCGGALTLLVGTVVCHIHSADGNAVRRRSDGVSQNIFLLRSRSFLFTSVVSCCTRQSQLLQYWSAFSVSLVIFSKLFIGHWLLLVKFSLNEQDMLLIILHRNIDSSRILDSLLPVSQLLRPRFPS